MTLSPRHQYELVGASGIPEALIAKGGVRTIATRAEVAQLGYTEAWQQLVPAIVFPVHPPDGSNSLYVIKPDQPRRRKDRPDKFVKYEWPHGHPHRLDVVGDLTDLQDPAVDLYVIEGWKKAAKLLAEKRQRGERCVIIVVWGVWAWCRKKDDYGDKRPELLPDWDLITLDGRRVFIVFDSDRDEKESVDLAARWLGDRLADRGAEVYQPHLPPEPDGAKNGLDDLIVRHDFEAYEQCEEAAIERGPHGTEALRAAWRRQRAINRDLKERFAATAALLEVPTAQLDPGEKVVLYTAAAELEKRLADKGSTDYRPFNLETMSKRAGLAPGTFGRKLDRFCKGETRLFEKQRFPACANPQCRRPLRARGTINPVCEACGAPIDVDDPRRPMFLRLAREDCSTFGRIVWEGIRGAETKDEQWGGRRQAGARAVSVSVPVCPEDENDPLHVLASCEIHGLVTCDKTVHRNTQDAFSPSEAVSDVDEGGNVQDAFSLLTAVDLNTQGVPSYVAIRMQDASFRLEEDRGGNGICPGCGESWWPRPGSDAVVCGMCSLYATLGTVP